MPITQNDGVTKDLFADSSDEELDPVAKKAVKETAQALTEAEKLTTEAEALVSAMTAPSGKAGDVGNLDELMRVAKENRSKRYLFHSNTKSCERSNIQAIFLSLDSP